MQKQQLIIFPLHQTTWDVVDSGTQINSSTWVAPESNSYEKSTQALSTWTLVFIEKINLCVFGLLSTQTLVFQVTSTWKLSPGWRYSRTLTETPDEALVASTTTSIHFFCFIWYQLHCDSKKLGSYVNSLQSFRFKLFFFSNCFHLNMWRMTVLLYFLLQHLNFFRIEVVLLSPTSSLCFYVSIKHHYIYSFIRVR